MARRKSRSKSPRRTSKTINALSVFESGMIASAVTKGFFDVNIGEFVMSQTSMTKNQITARELISGLTGGSYGTTQSIRLKQLGGTYATITSGSDFGTTVKENLANNGGAMLASLVLIPVGFRVVSKLTSKPRSLVNKTAKMAGLPLRV
tara:strand:- start:239 stop:685 length:447 start_codon:yes stop_codon:yes gene_type:complete